jgi:GTPase SAR1 family protein
MKITFVDGQENGIITEGSDQRESSLFKRQYELAHDLWHRLIAHENFRKDNNLMAFCGDRGTGKTSCMESFLTQLKSEEDANAIVTQTIDPSFFDDSHNILELVLGQIYNDILKDDKRENPDKVDLYAKQDLLETFNRIITNLKYLAKSENRERFFDSMEELDSLASGLNLQQEIESLFEKYLRYKNLPHGVVVIPIDDLDLNITGAYVMAECIRKYLINKYCVVVVSLRIDQLIEAISSHIRKQTPDLPEEEMLSKPVKYVTKLLPVGSRIVMPSFDNYFASELTIEANEKAIDYLSVQEAVVKLVYRKTGYLFYNSKGGSSLLIPRNLRSLRQLLHLLVGMADHDKNAPDKLHENQRVFKEYFFHTWTLQLEEEYRKLVMALLEVNNDLSFNKVVVSQLAKKFDKSQKEGLIKEILDETNYTYNVSLGDVFLLIDRLRQHVSDHPLQLYLFFISSLYSMKIYEAYDEVTEGLDREPHDDNGNEEAKAEIYASDALFDKINPMQRLVNGDYFSYLPAEVLPPKKDDDFRDLRLLEGNVLGSKLKELLAKEELNEEERKEFRMLEFFILTTNRHAVLKRTTDDYSKDRKNPIPQHLTVFNSQVKNLVFDVLAPFYNVLNLKGTYDRFVSLAGLNDESLYDVVYSRDWTLLHELCTKDYQRDYANGAHRFLSDAVLRNTEVLDAIIETIRIKRHSSYSSDDRSCLAEFYSRIKQTEMRTYTLHDEDGGYKICFQYLDSLIQVLTEASKASFDAIYNRLVVDDWRADFTDKTNKGSVVIRKISGLLPDLYKTKIPDEWKEEFVPNTIYKREESIQKIQALLDQMPHE